MPSPQSLRVIPVIDVSRGQVVHARRGERAAYRPIVSPLVAGSEPVAVARALLDRVPRARTLYVADLDALAGRPAQLPVVAALLGLEPACEIWLDAAFADGDAAVALLDSLGPAGTRVRPVFGTESLGSAGAWAAMAGGTGSFRSILSLDARHGAPIDPSGAWRDSAHWPSTVIVMTLDRVGAPDGPDLQTFRQLRERAPDRAWIGAGGIAGMADLEAVADAGAAGWLVASALHAGTLDLR